MQQGPEDEEQRQEAGVFAQLAQNSNKEKDESGRPCGRLRWWYSVCVWGGGGGEGAGEDPVAVLTFQSFAEMPSGFEDVRV